MRVVVHDDACELAIEVARLIAASVADTSHAVLGVATGATPLPIYRSLADLREEGHSFEGVHLVLLDEYLGLAAAEQTSNRWYVEENVASPLGIAVEQVHGFDGATEDPVRECERLEARIADLGGVDLQLLGIGRNGHVAFNEPGSAFVSRSRVTVLSESTRIANSQFFGEGGSVPSCALSQGIGTILEARSVVLVASGPAKAEAVRLALEGPIVEAVPASALTLHPRVAFHLDPAAARELLRPPRSGACTEHPGPEDQERS
jgi:glucosamine-6-phosphate deaminase